MRRILLGILMLMSIPIFAQNVFEWKPYASVGTMVSAGDVGYSAEYGVYSKKAWYAVGVSKFEHNYYGSFKGYFLLKSYGVIDNFFVTSLNLHLQKDLGLSLEPGFCTVFNISEKIAPQIGISSPIYESMPVWKPFPLNLSIGINYWIK